jgi:hypothetical protein
MISFQVGNEIVEVDFLFGLGIKINFELCTTSHKSKLLTAII